VLLDMSTLGLDEKAELEAQANGGPEMELDIPEAEPVGKRTVEVTRAEDDPDGLDVALGSPTVPEEDTPATQFDSHMDSYQLELEEEVFGQPQVEIEDEPSDADESLEPSEPLVAYEDAEVAVEPEPETVLPLAGIRDLPIEDCRETEQTLGLDTHVSGLVNFIGGCRTPMTISIQGDSGSGKTSLMQLIRSQLDETKVLTIWFNAWEFSQFSLSKQLPLILMRHFVLELERGLKTEDSESFDTAVNNSLVSLKTATWVGLSMESKHAGKGELDELSNNLLAGNVIGTIGELRTRLKEMVQEGLDGSDKRRIVLFIDDIDRLEPSKALELLEAIEIFLKMEGCVQLLACSFETIRQGIKSRLGEEAAQAVGRAIFDKMVQLSVSVPTSKYQVESFLRELLEQTGLDLSEESLNEYVDLLRSSVGFNPRIIKRIANSLILLRMLQPSRGEDPDEFDDLQIRKLKVLFAVGCFENAFNAPYQLALRKLGDDGELLSLLEHLRQEDEVSKLNLFGDTPDEAEQTQKLIRFMDLFFALLDAGKRNQELGREEIALFRDTAALMSLTSTDPGYQMDRGAKESAILGFCSKVTKLLPQFTSTAPDTAGKMLRGTTKKPWFAMWYKAPATKKAWSERGCRYELNFDLGDFDSVSSRLIFSTGRIREAGVPQETIEGLKSMPVLAEKGLWFNDLGYGYFEIVKDLGRITCNSVHDIRGHEVERVAKELGDFIDTTNKLFDIQLKQKQRKSPPAREAQSHPECVLCGTEMVPVRLKDGALAYKCDSCRKVFKSKPAAGPRH
ncbi:P-loop NTPase fold protein, partial [Thermodesulfobacteriota bacterium]